MNSSLKERLARLGPIRDVDRVQCGSPAVFVLRLPANGIEPKMVDATLALAKRGMTMLRAKRAIEGLLATSSAFVILPKLEDSRVLAKELNDAGIASAPVDPTRNIDVRQLRERLGLSREDFALRYGLEVESVRNWEIGRREPDSAAKSYLRAIDNDPQKVEEAYAPASFGT